MTRGPTPSPLPHQLIGRSFRVSDALNDGLTEARTRAADLDRRVHGVRGPRGSADNLLGRCRLLSLRFPSPAFISGPTAAVLLGAPLPWHLERAESVEITVPSGRRAPHADGVRGRSRAILPGDVTAFRGLRLSSPARLWCELSRVLDLPDLVAVGDHLIHHRSPLTTPATLAARARAGDRIGRGPVMTEALSLLDPRAESRPESRLRVTLARAGLPAPRINHVLVATDGGGGMRTDFGYPELKLAIEYQGDYHRTASQWRADMTRRMRLEAMGWYVLEINADDLRDPVALVALISSILARRG